jgi:hypothetical protein
MNTNVYANYMPTAPRGRIVEATYATTPSTLEKPTPPQMFDGEMVLQS